MNAASAKKVIGAILGIAIAIPLVLLLFITPASRAEPHELPIAVVGSQEQVAGVQAMLEKQQPGAFDVIGVDDQAALEQAAKDREVYGGFVLGPEPTTVIATGASPAVASVLTQLGTTLAFTSAAPGAPPVTPAIVDVATPTDDDPRGTGFGSIVMPLFMAGAALGMVMAMVLGRAKVIAVALPIGAAIVAATCVAAASAVGVLDGGFWAEWFAMFMGIFAIGAVGAGLVTLIGMAGIGIAALVFMLVGMPISGVGAPPEYLPWVWGDIGQWLPLGAGGTALRGAAFFAEGSFIGAGTAWAFVALALGIVVGYALLGLSVLKRRKLVAEVTGAGGAPAAVAAA